MSHMVDAYKDDIKAIRKQIKMIQKKNMVTLDDNNQEKLVDMRTAQDKQDLTTLNETKPEKANPIMGRYRRSDSTPWSEIF